MAESDEGGSLRPWNDPHVAVYWLKHYIHTGMCTLCQDTGIIELKSGSKHFCICPNGQATRWRAGKSKPSGGLPPEKE